MTVKTCNIQPIVLSTLKRSATYGLVANLESGFGTCMQYVDYPTKGAAHATSRAIACATQTGKHVLFCEDDVVMHQSAAKVINSFEFPPTVAIVSFCDMREMRNGSAEGIYQRHALGCDGRGWWGNQAILIHRDIARLVSSRNWFAPWIEASRGVRAHKVAYEDAGANCSDIRLSLLVHYLGGERNQYAVHVPSLFRHIGYRSLCFPDRLPELGERETRNWIGDRPVCNPEKSLDSQTNASFRADVNNPFVADSIANTEADIEVSRLLFHGSVHQTSPSAD